MTDFDKLLRAGLAWRDVRRAVFGQLGHYKKMDQYSEACDALEKVMNEIECDSLDTCFPLWTNERMALFQRLVAGGTLTDAERAQYYRRGARKTGARAPVGQEVLKWS